MVNSYIFVRFLLISLILTHLPIYRDFISGEPLKIRKFSYRNLRRQRNLFKFHNFAQKRYMVGSYNFVRFSLILQIQAHFPIYSSLISCEPLKIHKFNRAFCSNFRFWRKSAIGQGVMILRFSLILQILTHLPICSSLILGEPLKILKLNY